MSPYGTQICAPDSAQQVMEEVLHDIENTGFYLDYIGAFSFTWEHHVLLLDKIFISWRPIASLSTCLNASKRLIGLDIG